MEKIILLTIRETEQNVVRLNLGPPNTHQRAIVKQILTCLQFLSIKFMNGKNKFISKGILSNLYINEIEIKYVIIITLLENVALSSKKMLSIPYLKLETMHKHNIILMTKNV